MHLEEDFIAAIQASPADPGPRLAYARWLDIGDGDRAAFLRLQHLFTTLDPDHVRRPGFEQQFSALRRRLSPSWLTLMEHEPADLSRCPDTCTVRAAMMPPTRPCQFHREPQDTECDVWKRLLDHVEDVAAHQRGEFAPLQVASTLGERRQLLTLPASIAKLTFVERLDLGGSRLVRLPAEIGEMSSLQSFDAYMSNRLHWYPYELTRCGLLERSMASTRVLYGNVKHRPQFPDLNPSAEFEDSPRASGSDLRPCSVCRQPFLDRRAHRFWISLLVGTDVLPLLVNACSDICAHRLPLPPADYVSGPHRGGPQLRQPPF